MNFKKEKRHNRIVLTSEAIALREIRLNKKLSLSMVCRELQKTEAFLRHIETGRRDFPEKIQLETILNIYGITYKAFRHKVIAVEDRLNHLDPRDELKGIIDLLPQDKVAVVISMVKGLLTHA